jgi:hypothetical protein
MHTGRGTPTGAALALLGVTLASCSETATSDPFLGRDSAGIDLRQSMEPAWTSETAWGIDPDPLVTIGRKEGDLRVVS